MNFIDLKAGDDSITSALKDLGCTLPKDVHVKASYEDMGLPEVVAQALRNTK